jgi:UDP-N-acetylmuramyl pentapeptide phosphotransferase/UDP-N-acetylglucosamine-1-phosphate transferase
VFSFLIGFLIAPFIIKKLVQKKVWRKSADSKEVIIKDKSGKVSEIINKNDKDLKTPRMGGLVIVFSVILTVGLF